MEREDGMTIPGEIDLPGEEADRGAAGTELMERSGPTWRGFVLAILAAVVLSVMTTLLLGGSWSSDTLRPAAAGASSGCAPGGPCCPLPDSQK